MEKGRPRASTILDNRVNKKEMNTKWRIFRVAVGADTATNQLRKIEKSQRPIWITCSWATSRKENIGVVVGGKRASNKNCAQHRGPEEIDQRMNMPKAEGMAA